MTVDELIIAAKQEFEDSDEPNNIFWLHDEIQKLSKDDLEEFRHSSYSEALEMSYITAVAMKKEGTWDNYVAECKKHKKKAPEEIKREILEKYSLSQQGKIEK